MQRCEKEFGGRMRCYSLIKKCGGTFLRRKMCLFSFRFGFCGMCGTALASHVRLWRTWSGASVAADVAEG